MSSTLPAPKKDFSQMKSHAPWVIIFGVILIALGVFALGSVLTATLASVYYVGLMMFIGGITEIVVAFQMSDWKRFTFWAIMGVFSLIAGYLTFNNPTLVAGFLTLMLGILLVLAGITRFYLATHMKQGTPWHMMALSGAITAFLGLVILSQWPTSSLFTLGIFLGTDLVFVGFSWLSVGMALKRLP